jgi:predicted NAD/FAD-dependent oxidoreductase
MSAPLRYEYCLALKDAGYPQPEFAEGQTWYSIETAQLNWIAKSEKSGKFLRRPLRSDLVYAPGFAELAKATKAELIAFLTIEELADIWLAINKKR